jgi:enoyl-CoA hydratase
LIAAVAAGIELALWCDFRVMEQSIYFGVYCRHWGIPFGDKVAITFSIEENVLLI